MLTPSLLRTTFRDFTRRPWQSGLMILGVALGVAVVIAIDLANTSARRAFDLSTEAVAGRATHQILPAASAGLPQDLYRLVRVDWGYRMSAPIVEGVGLAPDLDGQPLRVLGLDPVAEAPFRNYLGGDARFTPGLERFYTEPGAVLIGPGLAETYGLAVDSPLRLQVNGRFVPLTVVGVLQPADARSRAALDGLLLMDVGGAQRVLGLDGADGTPPALTRIDLILTPAEAAALAARLAAAGSARLAPASAQADTVAQLTAAFQLNLTALSLLALVVGMFLIYNTIMFSVVQRRPVLGILRSLGVTGEQIFALIWAEAALVALLGGALGVGLGWLLGQGAVRLVTQTINDLYYVVNVRGAVLEPASVLKGLGLGLAAALLAAAAPALEAASVPPVTMAQRSAFEDRARGLLPWLLGAGLGLGALGAGLLLLITASLLTAFAGLFLIVIGLALAVPQATAWLMAGLRPLLRPAAGLLGQLAARTVTKAISRTSVAIAALMVAVSVTIGVSVMIASFRATVTNWLDLTLVADVYISAPAVGGGQTTVSLDPGLPARVRAVPGVGTVETIRTVPVAGPAGLTSLVVADSQSRRSARLYRYASGDPDAIWNQMQAGAVLVSEPYAFRHNLPPQGGSVTLQTDRGERTFPVAAVYYDYASDQGRVLISRTVYEQYWDDRGLSGVAVYAAPGQDVGRLAEALRVELKDTALQVQANRALRDQALVVFDRTFAITNALRLLAVVVAFIGVLSALMALQLERARELATLQALGLTAGQLWRLTFLETGLMGLAAGLFALPTGYVLALVLVYVINLRSFGWTIQLQPEPAVYLQALLVSVAAAVLAAIYPMRRLLRAPIAAALRQE
ncbi:MAG: ABC transporter permease [Anaerolineales bacterium]|nr:ABC transporter permease [Anaerolineales bacterium]